MNEENFLDRLEGLKAAYDELTFLTYKLTKAFPKEELFGLVSQIRRAVARQSPMARSSQAGQTLIETIVAIFVLVTGLSAGLGLAIYLFGSSTDIAERITATGLAREGVEVVRRMRDSNWLADTLTNCSGQLCYPNWLSKTFNIDPGALPGGTTFRVRFSNQASHSPPCSALGFPDTAKWCLDSLTDYRLYLKPGGGFDHDSSAGTIPTNFFRKVVIIRQDTAAPYSPASPLLLARSMVWWHSKNCPSITDLTDPNQTSCKIITEEFLTNWKNY